VDGELILKRGSYPAYEDVSISPDGAKIAYSVAGDGNEDIWIYDIARKTKTRLTFDEANDLGPVWTPDSKRIIFCSEHAGRQSIFWKAADGTGKVEQIASIPGGWIWPTSISRDRNTLFFGQVLAAAKAGGYNIGMLSMEGDHTPKLLLQENYGEFNPKISPDGQWLAYESNESSQGREVYVRPFPHVESGGK
jgi:Tol biopolymer transport system component